MLPNKEDGPSNTLLNYINKNNQKAPQGWNGCRALTEK